MPYLKDAVNDNDDNSRNRFFVRIIRATTKKHNMCMKYGKVYVNPRIFL